MVEMTLTYEKHTAVAKKDQKVSPEYTAGGPNTLAVSLFMEGVGPPKRQAEAELEGKLKGSFQPYLLTPSR